MIESRYEETIEELKEKLRNGKVSILDEREFKTLNYIEFACYFCRKPIKGNLRILMDLDSDQGIPAFSLRPIDSKCYAKAKGLEVI